MYTFFIFIKGVLWYLAIGITALYLLNVWHVKHYGETLISAHENMARDFYGDRVDEDTLYRIIIISLVMSLIIWPYTVCAYIKDKLQNDNN